MEKIFFNSYDDLVQYLDSIEDSYNKDKNELGGISIGALEIKEKKNKEERKNRLKANLINYVKEYEYYDRFLRDATTFRRQDFVCFLCDYFSVVYGCKYVSLSGVREKGQNKSIITYDLIISERDLQSFTGNNDEIKEFDFKLLFDGCSDCCLLLNDSLKFTLLDGKNLNSEFEDFPELIAAARSLINLKLSNPEMSDKRRLLAVLNGSCIDFKDNKVKNGENGEQGPKLEKAYLENN